MNVACAAPTVEQQEAILHAPSSAEAPTENPIWSTAYSKRLAEHGLSYKAIRADDDGKYFQWYKDSTGLPFARSVSNSMLRTSKIYANMEADFRFHKFQRFEELVNLIFSEGTIKVPINTFSEGQANIKQCRSSLVRILPGSLDLVTYANGFMIMKILYRSSIDATLAGKLKSSLPAGSSFTWHNRYKKDCLQAVTRFVSPDLPDCDIERADMEFLLDGIRQTGVHKFTKDEHQLFVYDSEHTYTNYSEDSKLVATHEGKTCPQCGGKHLRNIPRNPKTGAWAEFIYAEVSHITVRVIDLLPTHWIKLDYGCPLVLEQPQDFG